MRLVVIDYNSDTKMASVIDPCYMSTIVDDNGRVIRHDYKPVYIVHGYSETPLEVNKTYSFVPSMRWIGENFVRFELDYDKPNIYYRTRR